MRGRGEKHKEQTTGERLYSVLESDNCKKRSEQGGEVEAVLKGVVCSFKQGGPGSLIKKLTSEQRFEEGEGGSHFYSQRKNLPSKGRATAKALW